MLNKIPTILPDKHNEQCSSKTKQKTLPSLKKDPPNSLNLNFSKRKKKKNQEC